MSGSVPPPPRPRPGATPSRRSKRCVMRSASHGARCRRGEVQQREGRPLCGRRAPGAPPPPLQPMSAEADAPPPLRDLWEQQASNWTRWSREPGHDAYWHFHRDAFLRLVPAPGHLTLDIGCGEGRLLRDLAQRGHRVVGLDAAPTMVRGARDMAPELAVGNRDAAALPLARA